MKKIVVLGCGIVGSAIAKDLFDAGYAVTVADISASAFQRLSGYAKIDVRHVDLANSRQIQKLIEPFDLVIGAVPGFMGYATLKSVIEAGKNVVDISFFPEDPFTLNDVAAKANVTAVVDCGVAPGLSHILFGNLVQEFDQTDSLICYVGGLPVMREKPFEYRFCFSALDVIEEYTRLARYVEHGQMVVKEALSDIEDMDFASIGTLEAFNSDGLRTALQTLNVPHMLEKTLRYPGHAEKMKLLRDCGFFSNDPISFDDCTVSPMEMTAKVLFPKLHFGEGEADLTIMRIIGAGQKDHQPIRRVYDLFDRYDSQKNVSSMARTTGYTCSAVAQLFLEDIFDQKRNCLSRTPGATTRIP